MGMTPGSYLNALGISYRAPAWIIVALYDMVMRYELQVVDSIACAVPCIVILVSAAKVTLKDAISSQGKLKVYISMSATYLNQLRCLNILHLAIILFDLFRSNNNMENTTSCIKNEDREIAITQYSVYNPGYCPVRVASSPAGMREEHDLPAAASAMSSFAL